MGNEFRTDALRRYLNRPDATARRSLPTAGTHGDVAVVAGDGMHRIGRESIDLISPAVPVGAGEIETVLLGHPGWPVAVVGADDDSVSHRRVRGREADPQSLIDHVVQQLSVHKRPRSAGRRNHPATRWQGAKKELMK